MITERGTKKRVLRGEHVSKMCILYRRGVMIRERGRAEVSPAAPPTTDHQPANLTTPQYTKSQTGIPDAKANSSEITSSRSFVRLDVHNAQSVPFSRRPKPYRVSIA